MFVIFTCVPCFEQSRAFQQRRRLWLISWYPKSYRFKLMHFQKLFRSKCVIKDGSQCWHIMASILSSSVYSVFCVTYICLTFLLWQSVILQNIFFLSITSHFTCIYYKLSIYYILFSVIFMLATFFSMTWQLLHTRVKSHAASYVLKRKCVWARDGERSWSSSGIS